MVHQHASRRRSRPHAADFGVGTGVGVDLPVCDLDCFLQPVGEPLRGELFLGAPHLLHLVVDGVGGHLARQLASRRSAHTVGHYQKCAALADLLLAQGRLQGALAAR